MQIVSATHAFSKRPQPLRFGIAAANNDNNQPQRQQDSSQPYRRGVATAGLAMLGNHITGILTGTNNIKALLMGAAVGAALGFFFTRPSKESTRKP